MTENLAGRGEGLAGLVAKWRELKGRYLRTVPSSCGCRQDEDIAKARVFSDCADELETEIAALEAAARLPAAPAPCHVTIDYAAKALEAVGKPYSIRDAQVVARTLNALLARSSSVPVGEQKQEEGV